MLWIREFFKQVLTEADFYLPSLRHTACSYHSETLHATRLRTKSMSPLICDFNIFKQYFIDYLNRIYFDNIHCNPPAPYQLHPSMPTLLPTTLTFALKYFCKPTKSNLSCSWMVTFHGNVIDLTWITPWRKTASLSAALICQRLQLISLKARPFDQPPHLETQGQLPPFPFLQNSSEIYYSINSCGIQ